MRLLSLVLIFVSLATRLATAEPELPPSHVVPLVEVPFACGQAFPVSQAHFTGSHSNFDGWAWDFRMPEGTPIVSAMDGVVRVARGDSRTGGCDPKFAAEANYVVVAHGNGLETQYLHFSQVLVRAGDRVRAGDLLGLAGATGWACGPHLHFKVARTESTGWNNPSIPAEINGYGDPEVDTIILSRPCPPAALKAEKARADGGTPFPKVTATIPK